MTIDEIKKKSIGVLESHDVAFAGIFGSQARGESDEKSDIDFLVKFKSQKSLLDLIGLEHELSRILGRQVDIVTERALHPLIKNRVLGDLRVVYGQR